MKLMFEVSPCQVQSVWPAYQVSNDGENWTPCTEPLPVFAVTEPLTVTWQRFEVRVRTPGGSDGVR